MRHPRVLLAFAAVMTFGLAEAADPPAWWASNSRYNQSIVGGTLPDGGAAPISLDSSGRVVTTASTPMCSTITTRVTSCGTTPVAVPASRAAGSTSLEVVNSPENAGSPKMKCILDPADGGVGFGATVPGMQRSPGESLLFPVDSTHTLICVCDTAGTGIPSSECTP